MNHIYSTDFFATISSTAESSAKTIVPYLLTLITPKTAVDVGCGTGAWLREFANHGVAQIVGYDGPWNQSNNLGTSFFQTDLSSGSVPISTTFDLAICLEVAEHLIPSAGKNLIQNLTKLAPIVLFSAAAPGQGGHHHVNEQWPSYWTQAFASEGYVGFDCLRARFWNHPDVAYWYSQNTLLFVRKTHLAENHALYTTLKAISTQEILDLAHPQLVQSHLSQRAHHNQPWNAFRFFLGRLLRTGVPS